jgi:outer membrane lipoprotein-sorting protein
MIRALGVLLSLVFLAGCSAAPRSASYFEAHPADAQAVLADCKSGQVRGEECQTARAGATASANKARLELYRKGFQAP